MNFSNWELTSTPAIQLMTLWGVAAFGEVLSHCDLVWYMVHSNCREWYNVSNHGLPWIKNICKSVCLDFRNSLYHTVVFNHRQPYKYIQCSLTSISESDHQGSPKGAYNLSVKVRHISSILHTTIKFWHLSEVPLERIFNDSQSLFPVELGRNILPRNVRMQICIFTVSSC